MTPARPKPPPPPPPASTRVLYLDAKRYPSGGSEKLPGIRRYCATRGWGVEVAYRDLDNPGRLRKKLPSLLAALRPAGCIVESSWADGLLPPRLACAHRRAGLRARPRPRAVRRRQDLPCPGTGNP